MLEPFDHQAHELGCFGFARDDVGFRKQVAFQIFRGRIEASNQRGVLGRAEERGDRPQAMRLENLRHLGHRQPLGECEAQHERIAARDLVDHVERSHGAIEAIFPRFQMPPLPAQPEGEPVCLKIANDAVRDEAFADGAAARTGRNLHELLSGRIPAVRLLRAQVEHCRGRSTTDNDEEEQENDFFHGLGLSR